MQVDCIKITLEAEKIVTCKTTQQIDDADAVEEMKSNKQPVVYLFANEHLEELRKHVDVVFDRGPMDGRKGLTMCLAPKRKKKLGKIPLIESTYGFKGKAIPGIKTFLANIERRDIIDTFIVGVKKNIFDEIWSSTEKEEVKKFSVCNSKSSCTPPDASPLDSSELRLVQELEGIHGFSPELEKQYIGKSVAARLTRVMILSVAKSAEPVLILGDTGTGKEVVARAIHDQSGRDKSKFTVVNCGAIPSELLEFELFGVEPDVLERGRPLKKGLWEIAGDGTLFLDEMGDLRLDHQVAILRVLESGVIRRVGGVKDIKVFARVLAATNRNLFAMVQANNFREDLYHRFGPAVRTPTLRENPVDIPVLACFFWKNITKKVNALLSSDILEELCRYSWPGNVRELKNVLTKLDTVFQNKNPTVTNFRNVFLIEGRVILSATGKPVTADEISLQRTRCLQHLKRAQEVIYLCRYKFKGSLAEDIKSETTLAAIRESLLLPNNEIEFLCKEPTLFHDKEIFSAVYDFKGKISYLLSLLSQDRKSATEFLEIDIVNALDTLFSMITNEIKKVRSEG